ncbi:MAG: hypothetical protein WKF84_18700 [Pyrinomonadaceae bacterium]
MGDKAGQDFDKLRRAATDDGDVLNFVGGDECALLACVSGNYVIL